MDAATANPYAAIQKRLDAIRSNPKLTAIDRTNLLAMQERRLRNLLGVCSRYQADTEKAAQAQQISHVVAEMRMEAGAGLRESLLLEEAVDAKTLDEAGLLSREEIDRLTDEGLRDAVVGELAEEYREWEHRRDSHGRWARMPGGAAVLDKPHEFAKLAGKALTTGGGFSLDRDGHVPQTDRYVFSVEGYEHKVSGLPPEDEIARFYEAHRSELRDTFFFGGWHDESEDATYLDLSTSAADREEALREAGRQHQLAIWDAEEQAAIEVPEEFRVGDKKLTEAKQAENWQTGKSPAEIEKALRQKYGKIRPKKS